MRKLYPLVLAMQLLGQSLAADDSAVQEIDYLAFANGALPLSISDSSGVLKLTTEQALALIDGNPSGFVVTPRPGSEDTRVEVVYELPANTVFRQFAVPSILETPSPSQTFFARTEVYGSAEGPNGPFFELATQDLQLHSSKGQRTAFDAIADKAVRWVKVVLSGGLDIQRDKTYFEFSELYGFGHQETVPDSERFSGKWKGRGVLIELRQDGKLVSGCYDRTGDLNGAVSGNMLYATGIDRDDGIASSFVLTVDEAGRLVGVRSTNGAPFRPFPGEPAADDTDTGCSSYDEATLGCGSVVYGINFAFDSAELLPDSVQVLDALYAGLADEQQASIIIEGHTSSEGSEAYNQALSERRARAVVDALLQRGISAGQLSAEGFGEAQPVAGNHDEAGRALNRRVAVRCSAD